MYEVYLLWKILISNVSLKQAIPTRNRAQIINDAFSFGQANLINVTKPFEIIKYLSDEVEYLPWITSINRLRYSIDILETTSVYSQFQAYLSNLIVPIYNKLGWEIKPSDSWLNRYFIANYPYDRNLIFKFDNK